MTDRKHLTISDLPDDPLAGSVPATEPKEVAGGSGIPGSTASLDHALTPPSFTRVWWGYDRDQVDRYVALLVHHLTEVRSMGEHTGASTEPSTGEHRNAAFDVGTVLIDARQTADRVREDAEVDAADLVAGAEAEVRTMIEQGRLQAEQAMAARRLEIEAEVAAAAVERDQIRQAVGQIRRQFDGWSSTVLAMTEETAAMLRQFPDGLPTATDLDRAFGAVPEQVPASVGGPS